MSLLSRVRRRAKMTGELASENGLLKVVLHMAASWLGVSSGWIDRFTIHGHSVLLRRCTPDLVVAYQSLGAEFDVLRQSVPEDMEGLIIDAGGYIGTAAMAMHRMFPNATIVTIEPSSKNVAVLSENIAPLERIHLINAALVPESGPKSIQLSDRGTGAWGYTIVTSPADRSGSHLEFVDTVTIKSICNRFGFDTPTIVKLDIEGGERELLRDSGWLGTVPVLLVELHERIAPGCKEAFQVANAQRRVVPTGGEKFLSLLA